MAIVGEVKKICSLLFRGQREILVMSVEVGFAEDSVRVFERSMEFVTYVVSEYGSEELVLFLEIKLLLQIRRFLEGNFRPWYGMYIYNDAIDKE